MVLSVPVPKTKCLWVCPQVGPQAEAGESLLPSQELGMLHLHVALGF